MEPSFKELPELKVIGFPSIITDPKVEIPPMWELLRQYKDSIPNMQEPEQCLGLEFYPMDFETTKKFGYMPCFVVSSLEQIPPGLSAKIIPASLYAVFTHKGTVATIHDTFHSIYHQWLPNSQEYRMAQPLDFEYYTPRFKGPMDPSSELDIYVPITRK